MQQRLISPDFIKGICIILMVYGHISYIGEYSSYQQQIKIFIYTFHMPLFLIVSGILFHFNGQFKERVVKVLQRIGVPYVIFFSLYLLGLFLVKLIGIPTTNPPPDSFSNVIYSLFLSPYGGFWFLHSLLLIQISILVIKLLKFEDTNNFYFLLSILLIMLFLSQLHLVAFHTSIYFFIGMLLSKITNKNIDIKVTTGFLFILLFTLIIILSSSDFLKSLSNFEIIWCLLLFIFLWSLAKHYQNNLLIIIPNWIGRNSLSILCWHSLFIVAMKPLKGILLNLDNSGLSYSAFVTIMTILLSLFAAIIMDKLKLSSFIFGTNKNYQQFKH